MPPSDLKRTQSQLLWPNGAIVLLAAVLIASGAFGHVVSAGANYVAAAVIAAGLLIAWRFHAVRSIAGLLLFSAATFAFTQTNVSTPLFEALTLLLPLNLVALLLVEEFTLSIAPLGYWLAFVAIQAGVLAATCRQGSEFWSWTAKHPAWWPAMPLGPLASVTFVLAAVALLFKFAKDGRPLDAGLGWSLLPSLLSCFFSGPTRTAYLAVCAIAITVSVVETSYQLAYEDELTRLPGRRAFNQTIAALDGEYSIAMVDVDFFKKFNDTYGHEIGDQVLRMVASRLAGVSGEGRPFRCGGEEFAVVFAGKKTDEAVKHVEQLRLSIEATRFNVRGPARSQRRRDERRYRHSPRHLQKEQRGTSVTVSIGLAQPLASQDDVHRVIEAADKALYAAKQRGRNQVVVATVGRRKAPPNRLIAIGPANLLD